ELVGSEQDWKSLIKASLQEREEAEWKKAMEKKPKLRLYRTLKFTLEREEYLDVVVDHKKDDLELIYVVELIFSEWRWGGGRGSSWRTTLASFVQWVQWKTRLMLCYSVQPIIIGRDIGCMLTSEIELTMT